MSGSTRGVVVSYDTARGFGFIRSRAFDEDVFVHASAISGGGPRTLRPGQRVRFQAEPDARGPRAVWVGSGDGGAGRFPLALTPAQMGGLVLGATIAGLALALWVLVGVPWIAAGLVAVNLVTMAVYALDKHRAIRGRRRVPEWALLVLAAVGGSPGAALAMALLRHKTRKPSFRAGFAAVVVAQVLLIGAWFAIG